MFHNNPVELRNYLSWFVRLATHPVLRVLILAFGFLAIVIASQFYLGQIVAAPAANTIDGTVFRDYNENGTNDALEPGVGGINVTAYDANGNALDGTATISDGSYILNVPDGTDVRLEFTGLPSYLQPGPAGSDSGTTVLFVQASASGADVGLANPGEYCDSDPTLVTSCFVQGDQLTGPNSSDDVLVGVAYSANSISPTKSYRTPADEMGSTFGIAWQQDSQSLFASSYVKQHAGLGSSAGGVTATTGGIYKISDSGGTGTASLFLDLNVMGFNTGADPHPQSTDTCTAFGGITTTNANCWLHDLGTFPVVGKLGLGDMDFSSDQTLPYVVNLNTRKLIEIPVGIPATVRPLSWPMTRRLAIVPMRRMPCHLLWHLVMTRCIWV